MTAGTGNRPLIRSGRIVSQQFRQRGSSSLMHGRADHGFDRFQVEVAGLAAILKDGLQQSVYFAGDFLLDRFRSFFS
jgi:hypothetical protein